MCVTQLRNRLKSGKSDGGRLLSDHVIEAPAMLHSFLANFFIPMLRHGYVPVHFGMPFFCQFLKVTKTLQTLPITAGLPWHHVSVKC